MDKGDLPIGFTMSLSMDSEAMSYYSELSKEKQDEILQYVNKPGNGNEAKYRIDDVVHKLHNRMMG